MSCDADWLRLPVLDVALEVDFFFVSTEASMPEDD